MARSHLPSYLGMLGSIKWLGIRAFLNPYERGRLSSLSSRLQDLCGPSECFSTWCLGSGWDGHGQFFACSSILWCLYFRQRILRSRKWLVLTLHHYGRWWLRLISKHWTRLGWPISGSSRAEPVKNTWSLLRSILCFVCRRKVILHVK